jgi:molybdate transport system ATP-binding protein
VPEVHLEDVAAVIAGSKRLEGISFSMEAGEHWAFVGANGSGKSAFGKLLCNELEVVSGNFLTPQRTGYVSFEKVNEILEQERYNDDSDFLDYIDPGTLAGDFIAEGDLSARDRVQQLAQELGFTQILERGIKFLSTGELRKVLICKAVLQEPELLVLDEPFDGLDLQSCAVLRTLIADCAARGIGIVLLLNRFSEILPEITHVAYLRECRVFLSGRKEELLNSEALLRYHAFHYTLPDRLPELDRSSDIPPLPADAPLIEMKDVVVRYGEKYVLNRLNWTVRPGEHWRISGPNGAGKSTLLSLVSGDNPQVYANHVTIFGMKRGSGESVWDIKKRIGLVSTALQQDYRVGVTAKVAVISGFFDSIGVYGGHTKQQEEIADQWLHLLHMDRLGDAPLRSLSYGEQRLVLVARAMVKQPDLLILDEPCQGLDDVNREMVLKLVDHLGRRGKTQILYVTHHPEDEIQCITKSMELVPAPDGGFTARIS